MALLPSSDCLWRTPADQDGPKRFRDIVVGRGRVEYACNFIPSLMWVLQLTMYSSPRCKPVINYEMWVGDRS